MPCPLGSRTTTVKIAIRPFEEADAVPLQDAAQESSSDIYPWLLWCHPNHSIKDARSWIRATHQARDRGTAFEFAIASESGDFLGGCGLNHIRETDRNANLGYWVRSSITGQGVAPAAVQLLATWAFANTELERLEIVAAAGNLRSQRVAEKVGALRESVARSRLLLHEKFHDAVIYSIIRSSSPAA